MFGICTQIWSRLQPTVKARKRVRNPDTAGTLHMWMVTRCSKRRFCLLQVFQTFACDGYPEIEKRFLRADGRIACDTDKHKGYMVYAVIMIGLWELCDTTTYIAPEGKHDTTDHAV